MVTFLIILAALLLAIILIVCGFGWLLFIIGDIALGVWLIVKIVKKLCKK